MRHLKVSGLNNASAIESNLSMTAFNNGENVKEKENIFLIGLNFQNNHQLDNVGSIEQNSNIPVLMLKIDANKIMASQSANEKSANHENKTGEEENKSIRMNDKDSGPVTEIYTYNYNKHDDQLPHENLSFREMQVMKLIALGKTRKEIAEELFLSISTINTYRSRILDKLDMKNNADIMRYSFKHKIVE